MSREEIEAAAARAGVRITEFFTPVGRPEWQHAVCRFWHSGTLPLVYDQPVMSDVPALFLAGEFDPATLPAWAKTAAQRMRKAHYVEFADASHALTFSNSCAMRSVADFLQTPENWQRPTCAARQPGAHAQD